MVGRRLRSSTPGEAAALSLPFQDTFRNKALFSLPSAFRTMEKFLHRCFSQVCSSPFGWGPGPHQRSSSVLTPQWQLTIVRHSTLNNSPNFKLRSSQQEFAFTRGRQGLPKPGKPSLFDKSFRAMQKWHSGHCPFKSSQNVLIGLMLHITTKAFPLILFSSTLQTPLKKIIQPIKIKRMSKEGKWLNLSTIL